MSRRVDLPSDQTVQAALQALLAEADAEGTKPTVIELARRVGLTNTTFWRHFPDIGNQLRHSVRAAPATTDPTSPGARRLAELEQRNAELTRDNRQLTEHLNIAVTNIRRLALDNHHLRQALEASANITTIGR